MNIKICLLAILALSLFATSCSRMGSDKAANTEEIIFDDLSAEEREKILSSSGINLKENRALADNLSRIEIMYDNYGIKVEKQFYKNLPNLKYIAVHTFPNGSKQIIIYGQDGTVRSLSENMMSEILKASPEELTQVAPVYNEAQNPNTGGIQIKTLPPVTSQPQPVQPVNPTVVPAQQPTPAVEIAEQPAETKSQTETETKPQETQPVVKEAPTATPAPKNLKNNLQIYSPKKSE